MSRNIPLYVKVHDHLLNRLQLGEYATGDQLPPETDLASELGVSLITIRRAMQELSDGGWVVRQPGRGTFASRPTRIEQSFNILSSFTSDMELVGMVPSSTVLKQEVAAASPNQASVLKVKVGTPLFHLVRVRTADDVPILLESVCIPVAVCPQLVTTDFVDHSLYKVLTDYGVELTRSTQEFEPIVLSEEQSKLLQVPAFSPAFLRQAVSYHQDAPIEWVESIYRKDRFRFTLDTGKYSPKPIAVTPRHIGGIEHG